MTSQFAPFGLQALDLNWPIGINGAGPSLRSVSASDQNAFAVGDVVKETGASIGGVAVVSSALVQIAPGGTSYTPVGGSLSRRDAPAFIVVGIGPAVPTIGGISPPLPAGPKGSSGLLWVIAAGNREFLIAGDGSTPARGEFLGPQEAPLNLFARNMDEGNLFARLRYGAPTGGVSGTTLDGTSFTDGSRDGSRIPGGHGELHVLGLAQGLPLAARTMFRVRIRSLS